MEPTTRDLIKALRAMANGGINDPEGTTVLVIGQAADRLEELAREEPAKEVQTTEEQEDLFQSEYFPVPAKEDEGHAIQALEYLNQHLRKINSRARGYKPSKANLKYLNARVKDGYTITDFKTVIDAQVKQWVGTSQQVYLRPATLFNAEKFESYLNGATMPEPLSCNQIQRKAPAKTSTRDISLQDQLMDRSWAE